MEPPKTPSRNDINKRIPMTPVKKPKQWTHYLEMLLDNYEVAHRTRNPKYIERLLTDTFKYLKSFFSKDIRSQYYDSLVDLMREKYGVHKLNLVYELLSALQNLMRIKLDKHNKYAEKTFKEFLDEIKDDEAAITLSDEDLDAIVEYVKEHCVGDDCAQSVQMKPTQLAFDKLGVGGKKRKSTKKKIKHKRKTVKKQRKNKSNKIGKRNKHRISKKLK